MQQCSKKPYKKVIIRIPNHIEQKEEPLNKIITLIVLRRKRIEYAPDLPHYKLYQLSQSSILLGLLLFAAFLIVNNDAFRAVLLLMSGLMIFVSSVAYAVIQLIRTEKHDSNKKQF